MRTSEVHRVQKLLSCAILDTPPEDSFSELAEIASTMCGTPIALVSLVDDNRQWFKAKIGLKANETPKEFAFCNHAIQSDSELFVVTDARVDPRFESNPLVTGEPKIVFYAGAPLVTEDGHKLGTLCVIDQKPRVLCAKKSRLLVLLARQVGKLIELQINKRKRVKQKDEMETLVENLPLALNKWTLDQEGELRLKECNAAAKALNGFDEADWQDASFNSVMSSLGVPLVSSDLLSIASSGGSTVTESTYRNKDGVEANLFAVHFQNGPGTLVSLFRDISNLRLKERELGEAHRKLQLMTDGCTDAFWHWPDPNSRVLEWNHRFTDMLGYELNDGNYSLDDFFELLHPEDREKMRWHVEQSNKKREPFDLEYQIRHATGDYRWFRVRGTSYFDSSGKLSEMAGSISPIGKMIDLQQSLQETNTKLEQFAYQISHDLKAPLISTRRMCQIIEEDIQSGDINEALANVGIVTNQMNVLEGLVKGLLSYIHAGSADVELEPVDFSSMLNEIETHVFHWMEKESVQLTRSLQVETTPLMQSLRVRQVLQNLISNGIKYRNKQRSDCKVHVDVSQKQEGVVLAVSDNGRGIPEKYQERVFKTFSRFHSDTVGSGLGLSIVKQHVEAMGGSVSFKSNPDGTRFDVFIPVEVA